MTDEYTVCAAAFFRTVGKDVTTPDEFVMTASLELKWMSPSDAKLLLKALLSRGILVKKGDFVRPSSDMGGMDLPLAYKPSAELLSSLHSAPAPQPKRSEEPDLFHILMDVAKANGLEVREFVPACSRIQKRLDIDIAAAALMVLRDKGVDISDKVDDVYNGISSM